MNANDFRRIALGMLDAMEGAHMGHPDFRVFSNDRIFATLHADNQWGMVKLTPEQQRRFMHASPVAFAPESGAWGRAGCTAVRLDSVAEDVLGEAMTLAWQNAAKLPVARHSKPKVTRTKKPKTTPAKTITTKTSRTKTPRRAARAIRTSRKR